MLRQEALEWFLRRHESYALMDNCYEAEKIAIQCIKECLEKRQEARVLEWDEFLAMSDDAPVVEESKYPVNTWDKGTMLTWRGTPFLKERAEDHCWYNRDGYGRIWRCWTAWPTDEQREAVKWD